jgi:TonB-dependent starch-binding outer membrane protein SusC
MKILTLLLCILMCFPASRMSAQKGGKKLTISGTVLDINDEPVVNAILIIDGNKTSEMTDATGSYSLKVKPGAKTIGIVALGTGVLEQEIADRSEINFYFSSESAVIKADEKDATASVPESVNTGYNKLEKKNLTTSISKVEGKKVRSYSSIYEMLQTVPGVRVSGTTVVIHDARNFQGAVEPLFVVDGVPVTSVDDILPSTVESIEVLKGTAAAIYGTRAYGGVILIKRRTLD